MLKSPCHLAITPLAQKASSLAMVAQFNVPLSLRAFDTLGNKELLADSRTTCTRLPKTLYLQLLLDLESKMAYRDQRENTDRTGLNFDIFYKVPFANNSVSNDLPHITIQFLGSIWLFASHNDPFFEQYGACVAPRELLLCWCGTCSSKGLMGGPVLPAQSTENSNSGQFGVFGSFQQQIVGVWKEDWIPSNGLCFLCS